MLDIIVGERFGTVHYYARTSNDPITLTEGEDIECAGSVINVTNNSAPVCVDWDEDGDMDMLLGNQTGNVRLYLDDGGDSVPTFNTYSYIQSGGSNISHYRNCPQVVDLNGDGKKDLLCGANDYNIYYYENQGTNANPSFNGSEVLVSEYTGMRFCVVDWNGDGGLDILSSDYNGYVDVHIQQVTGTAESGGDPLVRSLEISRNPVLSSVTISGQGFSNGRIEIYDVFGRMIVDDGFQGEYSWNSTGEAPGTYFVRVFDGFGEESLKLIKL
ncbi:MAG: T9SS type A sorting domain-containing protein [Candidatus Aegiribacteria sp.]|nr:T9SS type A sorting domain-containing protein [Candidatus Aegiribacteria sp.]MBD3294107.1 T9SS type A sorting domain-containing protein [Candidatus Fermentibacteria bacterium]